ncbi:craniofacial development protein 2-like protein [Plakobranchus ocellatus]|uniref:Craniofacial development protein 2-like protein n=1 Tax=Plakobranchus ocellatus TaxID=259542 RepID=A0AAV4BJU8_9GAST|nr:craniofacial development protein 2-like protein [Plakobranchus ocellatus]
MNPDDRSKNKIEYILIQKRFRTAIETSKPLLGADYNSDFIPAFCKFEIRLKEFKRSKGQSSIPNVLLKCAEKLGSKSGAAMKNKNKTLNNISEIEELWLEMNKIRNKIKE